MTRSELQQKITTLVFKADDDQLHAALRTLTRKREIRELLTTKQTASLLEYHPESVKRLAREGKLHAIRYSTRKIRFDRDEVLRFRDNPEIVEVSK